MGVNACEGDVLAFDFNREVHFITRDDSQREVDTLFSALPCAIHPLTLCTPSAPPCSDRPRTNSA